MGSRFFPPRGQRTRYRPTLEALEGHDCPAVTATFAIGVLTVVGDGGPNQVAVTELGGGAVEVTGDGQQFPFAGVESIVVETLGGNDRVEYGARSPAAVSDMGDRQLTIDVGAGDDVMILRDPGPEPNRTHDHSLHFTVKLRCATGSDYLRAEVNHGSDVSVDVFSDDGGDDVGVVMLPAVQRIIIIIIPSRRIEANFDLRGGGNLVNLATGHAEEVKVNVKTSDRGGTAGSIPPDRYTFSFDGADRRGPFFNFDTSRLKLTTDLSDADDRVTIDAREFGIVNTDIDTGAGNDTVIGKYRVIRPRPIDTPATLAFDARLGDGDDRLDAKFTGYTDAQMNLDLGAGNDRGKIILWVRESTQESTVSVGAQLSAGDDFFRLFARGYDEARADLNTGPDGDTRDQVLAAFLRPGDTGLRRRNLVNVHSMDLGRVGVLGVGYATADITLQGHHCLVFFTGEIP